MVCARVEDARIVWMLGLLLQNGRLLAPWELGSGLRGDGESARDTTVVPILAPMNWIAYANVAMKMKRVTNKMTG